MNRFTVVRYSGLYSPVAQFCHYIEGKGNWKTPALKMLPYTDLICRDTSFFFLSAFSIRDWTSAFLLNIHRLCSAIEGLLSYLLPRWLRTGWQSVTSQGKILRHVHPGIELRPQRGQTVRYLHSPTELSLLTSDWLSCMASFTELKWETVWYLFDLILSIVTILFLTTWPSGLVVGGGRLGQMYLQGILVDVFCGFCSPIRKAKRGFGTKELT